MSSDQSAAQKPNLLVVEDDPENQMLLEAYLGRKFCISICDSEDTFNEKLRTVKVDVFLVDISLRGPKNGLELVGELRMSKEYSNAPIVCLTAHVFPKDKQNAMNAGVDEFLTRPIRNEDLMAAIIQVYTSKSGKTMP
jgi:CheY-like chemotaxis protein